MEVHDESNQVQDGLADQANSVGVEESLPEAKAEGHEESDSSEGKSSDGMSSAKKRLRAQQRAHEREVRELHARIGDLESRMTHPNQQSSDQSMNPYTGQSPVDEHIHKAVSYALQQKEMEERKAHEAQNAAHIQRKYQEFQKHLDNMGDKYDDFHDVVMEREAPYTAAMRDYATTLPRSGAGSAGEVLYELGRNPEELNRIAKLHPHDQASEMARLSHALISGGEQKSSQSNRPLGQIKSNPVNNSHVVTDKTPVGSIRQRMRAGTFK